jgi:hypothetical protein
LRQCHEEFGTISAKLQQVFTGSREYQADNVSADKLAATIIAIYGQMGQVGTILRKGIFDESDVSNIPRRQLVRTIVFFKDFLKHATTLLHSDIARRIVMPTLSQVTHFNDIKILRDLSRFTSTILSCVEGQLNDLGYVESGVCVLSHTVPPPSRMQEVIALAQKALSSAIAFVNDAPLDADEMPRMVAFTIHLNFLLRGHTFSDDLRELQVRFPSCYPQVSWDPDPSYCCCA